MPRLTGRLPQARKLFPWLPVALLLGAPLQAARSQSTRTLSVRVDNDAFDWWRQPYNRPDEEYTSGVRLGLEGGDAPWWAPGIMRGRPACVVSVRSCRSQRLELGQDIYTPSTSLDDPHASPTSRPNAGWLYVTQTARSLAESHSDELGITLGVTGPPALGQQMQQFFHSLAPDFNRPTDWTRHLAFEPGVVVRYERRARFAAIDAGAIGFDLVPHAGTSVGNIVTAADAGVIARVGWRLPHPWLPTRGATSLVFFAGVTGRAVAHDIFLDGNTFVASPSVERRPFTGYGEAGAELRVRWLTLGYRAVSDYRSYVTGPEWHAWGSMTGGVTFSR